MQQKGKVIFVGAGPGDPELLTVKAANALRKADVVIVDRLVNEDIITGYVPYTAQIIPVGKQGGSGFSTSQTEINELLVAKALESAVVIRLKGGDVSVFSNILDELLALKQAGISYELIPGITALSGAAAYTGVPLTARNHATGIRILTYYNNTIISQSAWHEMAGMKDTLVFYMSGAALKDVVANLVQNGADVNTPFMVVEQATTPQQFVHQYTLQQFITEGNGDSFISPSIVVIGKVTGLYKDFAWLPNNSRRELYFTPLEAVTELLNEIKHGDNVSRF